MSPPSDIYSFDESPRFAKRRRLNNSDDASSLPASSLHADPSGASSTRRRGRPRKRKDENGSLPSNANNARATQINGTATASNEGGAQTAPYASAKRRAVDDELNDKAVSNPVTKRPRGRPKKSSAPSTDVRLSHLIDERDEESHLSDGVESTSGSLRQSGRERRRPNRFLEQLSSAREGSKTDGDVALKRRRITADKDAALENGQPSVGVHIEPMESFMLNDGLDQTQDPSSTAQKATTSAEVQASIAVSVPVKRKRGRPRKYPTVQVRPTHEDADGEQAAEKPPLDERRPNTTKILGLPELFQQLVHDFKSEKAAQLVKTTILEKLTGRRPLRLVGLKEEYQKVHQMVKQSVVAGEGNSLLIIGARGTGKSRLVESVIGDLSQEHEADFHVVRLSGFIHTDDKLALKDIWRQLGREMEVEDDDMVKTNNYADMLASLLALLSHPSELSGMTTDETAKSVIFVLDEFDLFASHPRQTLLYNLLDVAQARKAPVAVLGVSTRIDVADFLEKRVKSRFSHRHVHVPLARSLPDFWDFCSQGLKLSEQECDGICRASEDGLAERIRQSLRTWNDGVQRLWEQGASFGQLVQSIYYRSKSVKEFLSACILPIGMAATTKGSSHRPSHSAIHASLLPPDSKLSILPCLSELELSLLIAAARLDVILDTDTCNFNMAYDEYTSLASRARIQTCTSSALTSGSGSGSGSIRGRSKQTTTTTVTSTLGFRVWGKDVGVSAWEKLVRYELLVPVSGTGGSGGTVASITSTGGAAGGGGGGLSTGGGGGGGGGEEVGRTGRMWRVDVALEEIIPALSTPLSGSATATTTDTGAGFGAGAGAGAGAGTNAVTRASRNFALATAPTPGLNAVMTRWCKEI